MRRARADLIPIPGDSNGGGGREGGREGGVHRGKKKVDVGSAGSVLRVDETTVADGDPY